MLEYSIGNISQLLYSGISGLHVNNVLTRVDPCNISVEAQYTSMYP